MGGFTDRGEIERLSADVRGALATAAGHTADVPDFLLSALTDRSAGLEPIAKRPTLVAAARLEVVKGGLVTADWAVALIYLVRLVSSQISDILRWTVKLSRTRSLT